MLKYTQMETTDPQGEQLTQVDQNNRIIGPIARKEAHDKDVYYRTIYVLIMNDKNQVLCQRRSPTKDLFPNCWDLSVGGHVNYGKSYVETAVREIGEEMGIEVKEEELNLKGEVLVTLPKSKEFFNVFEYRLKPGQSIKASAEEVSQTAWMTIDEIKKSMTEKTLLWYERPEQVVSALY